MMRSSSLTVIIYGQHHSSNSVASGFFSTVNARPVFIPAVMITAPDGVSGAYYHRYIQTVDNAT
jgi:hypothetical protein